MKSILKLIILLWPSLCYAQGEIFRVGVYLLSPQVRQFFQQAEQLKFRPTTFGATSFESNSVIADVLPLMEGAVYTHNAVSEPFHARYKASYGNDMQITYAANAYDFASLTARLFSSGARNLTAPEIIAKYATVSPSLGVSGPYHFSYSKADGKHFVFDIVVRKIQRGKTVEVFRNALGGMLGS